MNNPELQRAWQIIENTGTHLFLTGKAGTGKTTFLRNLKKESPKRTVIVAPTGIAAINAGGVTIHSFFQLPFAPFIPDTTFNTEQKHFRFSKEKINIIRSMDLLIIDEISMVRLDILDTIDRKLRWVYESDEPFGGVQVVMFGDLFQLPPVTKKQEREILSDFYDGFFFFNALVFKRTGFHIVELTKIFRQTEPEFINVLNNIRNYQVTSDELDLLSELKDRKISSSYDNEYIHICTHKADVEKINADKLGEQEIRNYDIVIKDKFPESSIPCDLHLKLRVGARVMSLVNDSLKGYYNGMLGIVTALEDNVITVRMDNGRTIKFERYTWSNTQYTLKDNEIVKEEIGSCTQFPLTLAWAITIHKSQGLTFDKIIIHVSHTFCPGQLYVALSRCRTLEGIVSDAFITKQMIIPEYALIDFERAYKSE